VPRKPKAGDKLTRADMALIAQGARDEWPIPLDEQVKILRVLGAYIEDDVGDEGPETIANKVPISPRTKLAAIRAVAQLRRLRLQQSLVDLHERRLELNAPVEKTRTAAEIAKDLKKAGQLYDETPKAGPDGDGAGEVPT